MKTSVCITTHNENLESIKSLLDSLNNQTLKPDEIIIVDAGQHNSKLQTLNSKLDIKYIHKPNISRAEGRNEAIKMAKNEIIAITDVGCIPNKDWLEKITKKLFEKKADVVAGGYKMTFENNLQKTMSVFLGVSQKDMGKNFMPSARSMALTKTIWKKTGGFPEDLNDTAEDTVFNINLIKAGAKFVTTKEAIVTWQMPNTIVDFAKKIYKYAKGDAISAIWWHPVKKLKTHNLKVATIFLRYLFAFIILAINFKLFLLYAFLYTLYAFYKAGYWGIPLQFVSDFACIIGFSHGIFSNYFKRS
jgi:glycosyltransferase involved in cell wall biosynthesis